MKKLVYSAFGLLFLFSCGKKDKFECDVQNQMAPADDSGRLFVPNAFSPNGDGLNDIFKPWCINLKSIDFYAFDADNKLVFHTAELNTGWTGDMDVKSGVSLFHYKISAVTNQDNTISQCGDFYIYKCLPDGFDCTKLIFGDQFDPSFPDGYLKGSTAENFIPCNP